MGTGRGYFELVKSIKITANNPRVLSDFIEIIIKLVNFFSICLNRKLLILKIWSFEQENTLRTTIEIKTYQHYILNKDYEHGVEPFKKLATYTLLRNNFEKIVNNYIKSMQEEYRKFPVVCDLYMRYNDAPIETLLQINFLLLMQGIEAYVGRFEYDSLEVPSISKVALKKFKSDNVNLPEIDKLTFPQLSFQTKINNTIKKLNIENIINFKLEKEQNYKLINQMIKYIKNGSIF